MHSNNVEKKHVQVGNIDCGSDQLFLISGPCVIEEESLMMETAEGVKQISERLKLPLIFKSSFIKDNRSSLDYYYGPGLENGLRILEKIKNEFDVPVLTDVHYPQQVEPVAETVDIVQIPAYLCAQTSLLVAAAKTKAAVNLKHGQFMAPEKIGDSIRKVEKSGSLRILVTERGYTFGYNDLIVDPRSFYHLQQTGYPVIFDITHSIRKYGVPSSDPHGGSREYLGVISRAGVATGIDGLFIEAHPNPSKARCDAASQYPIDDLEEFIKPLIEIHDIVKRI